MGRTSSRGPESVKITQRSKAPRTSALPCSVEQLMAPCPMLLLLLSIPIPPPRARSLPASLPLAPCPVVSCLALCLCSLSYVAMSSPRGIHTCGVAATSHRSCSSDSSLPSSPGLLLVDVVILLLVLLLLLLLRRRRAPLLLTSIAVIILLPADSFTSCSSHRSRRPRQFVRHLDHLL